MITLSIRYTINPNKLSDFKEYVEAEQNPIHRSGGQIIGYFLPTASPVRPTRRSA